MTHTWNLINLVIKTNIRLLYCHTFFHFVEVKNPVQWLIDGVLHTPETGNLSKMEEFYWIDFRQQVLGYKFKLGVSAS